MIMAYVVSMVFCVHKDRVCLWMLQSYTCAHELEVSVAISGFRIRIGSLSESRERTELVAVSAVFNEDKSCLPACACHSTVDQRDRRRMCFLPLAQSAE